MSGMRGMIWSRSALSRCMGSDAGSISVEFGFILPFLLMMMLGIFEFGRFGLEYTRLVNAARAGAQYAIQDQSTAADIAGITKAVRDDAGDTDEALRVDARRYCFCPTTNEEVSCTAACSDGKYPPMYVDVSVGSDMARVFPYIDTDLKVAVSTTMRIR